MDFVLISNNALTEKHLNDIGALKAQHWPHPVSSQVDWILKNYNENDLHVILDDNGFTAGYVALADLKVTFDGKNADALGISCLCVDKNYQGKGLGLLIMEKAFKIAKEKNKTLCLLCKEKLVDFYKKCGYLILSPEKILVADEIFNHNLMLCDNISNGETKALKSAKNIFIDRNF